MSTSDRHWLPRSWLERHQVAISKETLRQWVTEAGIWTSRRERKRQLHQPRGRRDCLGELVQIDGSHHWGSRTAVPNAPLLVFIDDATGQLLHLRSAASENTFDYFRAAKAYLSDWGKPLAFYSDKHGIFRTTHGSELDRTSSLTQFGRALLELNIDTICANTSAEGVQSRRRRGTSAQGSRTTVEPSICRRHRRTGGSVGSGTLSQLRADLGGREVGGEPRPGRVARDVAEMDGGGWNLAVAKAAQDVP